MKLFGRKKQIDSVPAEVQEYYQAERRERKGLAWLLAAATLVGTLLLASGLFFGGKWVVQKVTNDDKKPVATDQKINNSGPTFVADKPDTNGTASDGASTPAPAAPSQPTPAATPTPNPTATAPVASSGAASSLVNSGPGDTVALFIGTVVLATISHRLAFAFVRK